MERKVTVAVKDLGMAAYLKMKGYDLHERHKKEFYFIIHEAEREEFKRQQVEYVNSAFCKFDSEIMALKKL